MNTDMSASMGAYTRIRAQLYVLFGRDQCSCSRRGGGGGGGGMNYDIFVSEGFNTTIHRYNYKALPNAPWEMLSVKATAYCIPY